MYALILVASFIFGLILASFLNVIVCRMGTGWGIMGRSVCLSCNRALAWYELIPVISHSIQGGKCRHCKTRLSWQDPVSELALGLFFAATVAIVVTNPFIMGQWIMVGIWLVVISIGFVIAMYDIRHRIIHLPSLIVFFIVIILLGSIDGFSALAPLGFSGVMNHIIGAGLVPLPFFILWIISRGAWIGFGDIEIMAVIGAGLGLLGGFSALCYAFWIACAVVIPVYGYYRLTKQSFHRQIPLGPFLLIGFWMVGTTGITLVTLVARMIQYLQ